jgi:uroporphyrinogen-III decarboxylase
MLTPKENYLRALRHEETEYVPIIIMDSMYVCSDNPIERPVGGGVDGFGVRWVDSGSAGGATLPAPGEFVLDDVLNWKKKLTIPDLNAYNWDKFAEEASWVDRSQRAVGFLSDGVFLRLTHFMGFEKALIAMVEEPDAVNDIYTAVTDYKIKFAEKVAQYIKPDTFTYADDFASELNLFTSPETYRALIKPHHKRFFAACRNLGMIPIQHTCGRAEDIVEDIIDVGAEAWSAVQPRNDIGGLLDKYGDRLAFEGGFNSNTGRAAMEDATIEEIEAEVKRCYDEYGGKKGYIFFGSNLKATNPQVAAEAMMPTTFSAALKLRAQGR